MDLAGLCDEEQLRTAVDDALLRELCDAGRLKRRLQAIDGRGRRGISLLRRIVDEPAGHRLLPRSVLEQRYLQASNKAGLPRPHVQFPVVADGRTFFIDFAYPAQMLAIELDGWRFHGGRRSWEADIRRSNALVALGWRVLRGTWTDLQERPGALVERVRQLVAPNLPGLSRP